MIIPINFFPCLMQGKHLLLVGYDLLGGDTAILPMWKANFPINEQLNRFNSKNVSILAAKKLPGWGWDRMTEEFTTSLSSGTPALGVKVSVIYFLNMNVSRIRLLLLSAVTSRASNTVPIFDGDVADAQI